MQIPSAQELMRAAELETGLSDWQTEFTGTPAEALEILVCDLNTTAQLHELGARRVYRRLHETLCSRLRYVADRKLYPQCSREEIDGPIFILGLPRAGTTFLHNLLGADPANRSPRSFEMQYPSPKIADSFARDLRIQRCHESFSFAGLMDDDWQAVHPMGAARADECGFIWELSLLSMNYAAIAEAPNYEAYFYAYDFRKIYREERAFLQYLQHREEASRWILKTPIHVRFLDEIVDVFPTATFVHCHRDTAKIYPSLAHLVSVLRSKHSDFPPAAGAVARDYDGTWQDALTFRQRPAMAERFVDLNFVDFQADPIAAIGDIYRRLNFELTPERQAALEVWLEADRAAHTKRPRHHYRLEDAGLTFDELDQKTGDYLRAFNVPLER
jgi:hypothetical protein